MKIFGLVRKIISNFIAYLFEDRRNMILFICAIPFFIILFFGLIFVGYGTGILSGSLYKAEKDKDENIPPSQNIVHLDQGWKDHYRQQFYFTPQGSPIIPLDVAKALEMPRSTESIFGENGAAITQFGYLPYPSDVEIRHPESANLANGLPIGFTVDGNINKSPMLGMNCAACHTSDITYQGKTIRIDGGAALGDFMGLIGAIDASILETLINAPKFDRLAQNMGLNSELERAKLREKLEVTSARRQAWQTRNAHPIPHGHGRVDAFSVIFNQALAKDLHQDTRARLEDPTNPCGPRLNLEDIDASMVGGNINTPCAPVSYPVLWDTPFMGRVQWNGSANNMSGGGVLGRNTGQVLGVFGRTEVNTQGALPGYCSTVNRSNLELFDYWSEALKSPEWADAAGQGVLPPLDQGLVSRGREIYNDSELGGCAACHSNLDEGYRDKLPYEKQVCDVPITLIDARQIGTDLSSVDIGLRQDARAGVLAGQKFKQTPPQSDVDGLIGADEAYLTLLSEIVASSIIGTFQSVTCDGKVKFSTLVESAVGFGQVAKSSRLFDKRVDGGFTTESTYEDDGKIKNECSYSDKPAKPYNIYSYKARPLNGIWASAPYLHNGSVPTLHDILLPADKTGDCPPGECRPSIFYVGSTEFDPDKVGFNINPSANSSEIDTSLPGNSNSGHEIGFNLSEEDKKALIEYLKSL